MLIRSMRGLPSRPTRVIRRIAEQHDYVCVPSRILDCPYDGENPGASGFSTWGRRFFDWI